MKKYTISKTSAHDKLKSILINLVARTASCTTNGGDTVRPKQQMCCLESLSPRNLGKRGSLPCRCIPGSSRQPTSAIHWRGVMSFKTCVRTFRPNQASDQGLNSSKLLTIFTPGVIERELGNAEGWATDFSLKSMERGTATHVYASFHPDLISECSRPLHVPASR